MQSLFAVSAPGLAKFTALECRRLGFLGDVSTDEADPGGLEEMGGVAFRGDLRQIYQANLHLRTASRVLLRLGVFYAAAFSELRKKASRLEWERFLKPGQPVSLRMRCHKSRLYHSDAVAERVAGAIGDRLGVQPAFSKDKDEGTAAAQLVVVRLVHDQCTISLDSSGELLHRRGYRLATAKAPLRETLAAGLLMACEWDGSSPLLDPFCGSGTIAIEAAMIAKAIPPGLQRRFAFMDWPGFDKPLWDSLAAESRGQIRVSQLAIHASDRDAGAIEMAAANAARVGVSGEIQFSCRAVSAIDELEEGWVVTNPPYGLRVSSNKDLRNLYAQFGNVLRQKCRGSQVGILSSDLQLLRQVGLPLDTSQTFVNGGIKVFFGRRRIPAQAVNRQK